MNVRNKTTRNTIICYTAIVFLFVIIRMLSQFGVLNFLGTIGTYLVNAFVQIGMLFAISIFMFKGIQKAKVKDVFKYYGFKKISWKAVLNCFLIGIIVYILNVFVATFFNAILSALGYNFASSSGGGSYPFWLFLINLVVTAVLPAICEETAHRGMLLKGLSNLGSRRAIIISSLLFGCMHMNIEQFFYATCIGLFLGYLTTLCDTIYPAMIIHFSNNALSLFMGFSNANGLGFNGMFTWLQYNFQNNFVVALLFVILLVILLVIALKALTKLLFKETALKRMHNLQEALFAQMMKTAFQNEMRELTEGIKATHEEDLENFDKIFMTTSIETDNSSEIDNQMFKEDEPFKLDTLSLVLLVTCFILTGAVTLMTFIIGVL